MSDSSGGLGSDLPRPSLPPPTLPPLGAAGPDRAMTDPTVPNPTVPLPPVVTASVPVVDSPTPRRSRGKVIGAVAGVGALLAAGTFAVVSIAGNDGDGGASSPEAVGLELFEALGNEDALGVIDLLLPGERETFRQPVIDLFDNLRRIEVIDPSASLGKVGGLDFEFSDLQVNTESTGADDIVKVVVDGSVTSSVDGAKVPIGSLLVDEVFDGERPDMTMESETDEVGGSTFAAVERDGRWYLSLFYSVAESARGDSDVPDRGVEADGADSPDGAVDQLLSALEAQDLEGIIATLDPTEAEALQRYAPLFLDDAQQALRDAEITWSITDRVYSVDGSGSRRHVGIDSLTFQASSGNDDSSLSLRYADGCATIDIDGESTSTCEGDGGQFGSLVGDAGIADEEATQNLADAVERAFEGYSPQGIAVHEVDGQWYVSPLRSTFDLYNGILATLDKQEIVDIIDAGGSFLDTLDVFGSDTLDDGGILDGGDVSTDGINLCYSMMDAAEALSCIQTGLADGSIDPSLVPVTMRFPECGVSEVYWNDVYSMTDEEFTAMAEAASPCFLDLIATGAVDSYEVPYELLAPQCMEGRNWYTTDESAYNERVFQCAEDVRLGL
jgi:hypothetical protein